VGVGSLHRWRGGRPGRAPASAAACSRAVAVLLPPFAVHAGADAAPLPEVIEASPPRRSPLNPRPVCGGARPARNSRTRGADAREACAPGVERSVCVTAWYFDSLFGVLPENEIVERRRTHGRPARRGRVGRAQRLRRGVHAGTRRCRCPSARQRLLAVFGRDTDEAFVRRALGRVRQRRFHRRGRGTQLAVRPRVRADARHAQPPETSVPASGSGRLPIRTCRRATGSRTGSRTSCCSGLDRRSSGKRDGFAPRRAGVRAVHSRNAHAGWGNHLRISGPRNGMLAGTRISRCSTPSAARGPSRCARDPARDGSRGQPIEYQLLLIHRQRVLREWLVLRCGVAAGGFRQEVSEPRESCRRRPVVSRCHSAAVQASAPGAAQD